MSPLNWWDSKGKRHVANGFTMRELEDMHTKTSERSTPASEPTCAICGHAGERWKFCGRSDCQHKPPASEPQPSGNIDRAYMHDENAGAAMDAQRQWVSGDVTDARLAATPDDPWQCEVNRSHGRCNTLNDAEDETCGACGNERPSRPLLAALRDSRAECSRLRVSESARFAAGGYTVTTVEEACTEMDRLSAGWRAEAVARLAASAASERLRASLDAREAERDAARAMLLDCSGMLRDRLTHDAMDRERLDAILARQNAWLPTLDEIRGILAEPDATFPSRAAASLTEGREP